MRVVANHWNILFKEMTSGWIHKIMDVWMGSMDGWVDEWMNK